ncbi:25.3 kDa vesicle transport protein [Zea mays]|uniref:25.3 kDa vesicle transport protein n=1 Tax=Zea mays TaxID=4577 RepID=A0A1D6LC86_MAIZE|nr:25.3 kDa vesicle transport protein [Zea mays]
MFSRLSVQKTKGSLPLDGEVSWRVKGNQIETAARPYAFIKFDTFIHKTKKLYLDTRTQRNLAKLNDELYEVHQIMTLNVQEVLGVGEKLDYKISIIFCQRLVMSIAV